MIALHHLNACLQAVFLKEWMKSGKTKENQKNIRSRVSIYGPVEATRIFGLLYAGGFSFLLKQTFVFTCFGNK
jgi:hypothetical protein